VAVSLLALACGRRPKDSDSAVAVGTATLRPLPKLSDAAQDKVEIKAAEASGVPAGTTVPVMVYEGLDSDTTPPGTFGFAIVDEDVRGTDSKVAIPKGSPAVIVVRESGKEGSISVLNLGLYQLTVDGKPLRPSAGSSDLGKLDLKEDSASGNHLRAVHLTRQSRLDFRLSQPLRTK